MVILAMLEANYSPFKNPEAALDLWSTAFSEDDFLVVKTAVMAIIETDTETYRPNIGKVRRKIYDIIHGERMSELEAWGIVKVAVNQSQNAWGRLDEARREWEKLPPTIRQCVTPRQLRDWGDISTKEFDTVVQSNFMRSYRDVVEREYQADAIPDGLKKAVGAIREQYGKALPQATPQTQALPPVSVKPEMPEWAERREVSDEVKAKVRDIKGGVW